MTHGNYKCSKCGAQFYSKCRFQRTVFGAGDAEEREAMMSHVLKRSVKPIYHPDPESIPEKHRKIPIRHEVTIVYHDYVKADTDEERIERALEIFRPDPPDTKYGDIHNQALKYWVCDHDLVPTSECMFGCCKPKETAA